jgi:hypothetical protein
MYRSRVRSACVLALMLAVCMIFGGRALAQKKGMV